MGFNPSNTLDSFLYIGGEWPENAHVSVNNCFINIADDLMYLLASGHGLDINDIFDDKNLVKQPIRVETIERIKLCNGWAKEAIPKIVLEKTGKPATPEFIEGATRTFGMWWLRSLEGVRKSR